MLNQGEMDVSKPRSHDDSHIIAPCRKMLAACQKEDEIIRRAGAASKFEPELDEALEAEFASVAFALTQAAPPVTLEGIRALAQVAMVFSDRDNNGELCPPYTFGDWVKTAALLAAAGQRETIPLPITLPDH
jgi:hypothetical protein